MPVNQMGASICSCTDAVVAAVCDGAGYDDYIVRLGRLPGVMDEHRELAKAWPPVDASRIPPGESRGAGAEHRGRAPADSPFVVPLAEFLPPFPMRERSLRARFMLRSKRESLRRTSDRPVLREEYALPDGPMSVCGHCRRRGAVRVSGPNDATTDMSAESFNQLGLRESHGSRGDARSPQPRTQDLASFNRQSRRIPPCARSRAARSSISTQVHRPDVRGAAEAFGRLPKARWKLSPCPRIARLPRQRHRTRPAPRTGRAGRVFVNSTRQPRGNSCPSSRRLSRGRTRTTCSSPSSRSSRICPRFGSREDRRRSSKAGLCIRRGLAGVGSIRIPIVTTAAQRRDAACDRLVVETGSTTSDGRASRWCSSSAITRHRRGRDPSRQMLHRLRARRFVQDRPAPHSEKRERAQRASATVRNSRISDEVLGAGPCRCRARNAHRRVDTRVKKGAAARCRSCRKSRRSPAISPARSRPENRSR